LDKKKVFKDRNGTPIAPGDFVRVYSDHAFRPDYTAKVLYSGVEASTLRKEGERGDVRVDNKCLEVL